MKAAIPLAILLASCGKQTAPPANETQGAPAVAGPYVEGSYEMELPVSADLIAAIRSDYRKSFEVQPQ